jgi:putative methionine-R-sulfoxide reductase with GAF domain
MTRGTIVELAEILERGGEADDVLRAVVARLAETPGVTWAGIAFLEEGELVLGPESGEPDEAHRVRVPIAYGDDPVGELRVDGEPPAALLETVAALLAPYVLIGWDTGGDAWEP